MYSIIVRNISMQSVLMGRGMYSIIVRNISMQSVLMGRGMYSIIVRNIYHAVGSNGEGNV